MQLNLPKIMTTPLVMRSSMSGNSVDLSTASTKYFGVKIA